MSSFVLPAARPTLYSPISLAPQDLLEKMCLCWRMIRFCEEVHGLLYSLIQKSSQLHGSAIMHPLECTLQLGLTACDTTCAVRMAVRTHCVNLRVCPERKRLTAKEAGFLIWFETWDSTQKLVNFHRNRAFSHTTYTKSYKFGLI